MKQLKHFFAFFGPPGAGKGTQAKKTIQTYPNLYHLSSGDIFRDIKKESTPLALQVKTFIDNGRLVPDVVTLEVVKAAIRKINNDTRFDGCILDGVPRNLYQLHDLKSFLSRYFLDDYTLTNISISVEREELIRRLLNRAKEQGRLDDTPQVIKKRLAIFENETKPMLDYLRERGVLYEIPAMHLSVDELWEKVNERMPNFQNFLQKGRK